jgi:phytoene dehydrogenase-like protein
MGHALRPGRSVMLHADVATTAAALGPDRDRWRRIMGPMAGNADRLAAAVLDPTRLPPPEPIWTMAFGATGLWPTTWVNRGVLRGEQARVLLTGSASHAMVKLSEPLTTGVGLLFLALGQSHGWPFAAGGSASIADALIARLQRLGGEVRVNHRVRSMADVPSARAVLFDLTPRQVLKIAGDRFSGRYRRRLQRWRYGAGSFKVDWALDGPVPWADPQLEDAGVVHLAGTAAEMVAAERAVQRGRLPRRPFVLFAQASVADPSRAPAGKHTGWAYCHVPQGCDVDLTESIEARIEEFAPGFRERILARHSMGPRELEAHNANEIGGDIAGGRSDWRQIAARPVLSLEPWATPDPQLFLCSSSTLPGAGVHGMCGWNAARSVLRRLG